MLTSCTYILDFSGSGSLNIEHVWISVSIAIFSVLVGYVQMDKLEAHLQPEKIIQGIPGATTPYFFMLSFILLCPICVQFFESDIVSKLMYHSRII